MWQVQADANFVLYAPGHIPLYASSWHRWQSQQFRSTNPAYDNTQCTYYALERMKAFLRRPANLPQYASWPQRSDAGGWDDYAPGGNWNVQDTPTPQAIVVFDGNRNGYAAAGHVAWVDGIQARSDGVWVHVMEMNFERIGTGYVNPNGRWVRQAAGMHYITAPSV